MLIFREVEKKEWENFVLSQPYTLFVQSKQYAEFYEAMGETAWILGVFNGQALLGGAMAVSTHAKRGKFLLLPYGPVMPDNPEAYDFFLKKLEEFAREQAFDFIRISPFLEKNDNNLKIYASSGFRNAPMHVLAENTWLLDLKNKTADELLRGMEKNHRGLVKRCEKEGVKVSLSESETDLEKFNAILDETGKRHNFVRFSRKYVQNEFAAFKQDHQVKVFLAYLPDGRLDSGAVIMYYGNMACYRHGASLGLNSRLPTSYLLQWTAIQEALKSGQNVYNFWGIAPQNCGRRHPFFGITHFKKGFGGRPLDLVVCQDKPLTNAYWLNWVVETIRRVKRGFS